MWDFLAFILIGLIAGWLASTIVKGGGMGVFADIIVGIIGALLGGFLFGLFGFGGGNFLGQVIVATIGAVLFLAILRAIKR